MTDIVERLTRKAAHDLLTPKCRDAARALFREAADEIERLRAEFAITPPDPHALIYYERLETQVERAEHAEAEIERLRKVEQAARDYEAKHYAFLARENPCEHDTMEAHNAEAVEAERVADALHAVLAAPDPDSPKQEDERG